MLRLVMPRAVEELSAQLSNLQEDILEQEERVLRLPVSGACVRVGQDAERYGNVAGTVWDCAVVFSYLLDRLSACSSTLFRDKICVELGAGTGVCGLALAALGAREVWCTDLPEVVPLIQENVERNATEPWGTRTRAAALVWGEDNWGKLGNEWPQLVIASDVVYVVDMFNPLRDTLLEFARHGAQILLVYEHRKARNFRFFERIQSHFRVREVDESRCSAWFHTRQEQQQQPEGTVGVVLDADANTETAADADAEADAEAAGRLQEVNTILQYARDLQPPIRVYALELLADAGLEAATVAAEEGDEAEEKGAR